MAGGAVDVTVVVVTFNSAETLPGFLSSLPDGLDGVASHELVVTDNGSTDGTLEVVARLAAGATVFVVGANRGYAAGINAGIAAARHPSRAVLVANPDVRLGRGCVERLLRALHHRPDVGIVVPKLLHRDGSVARTLRREPTVLRAVGEAVLGGNRAGRVPAFGEVITDPAAYEHPRTVTWATGALMLISRDCLERVGAWDESFFLYSEETDFALRARDAGLVTWYLPDATATHLGGDAHRSPQLWALLSRNRVRLFARRHGRARTTAFRSAVVLNEALRALAGRATSRAALRALVGTAGPTLPGSDARG
ncbi:MAG TPA: glycosyltransferase family 2 protein [Nitriliruptorales bacterium]|nr:glycosyltransferase family 2 protein [Nitriliruptorales bacterium]